MFHMIKTDTDVMVFNCGTGTPVMHSLLIISQIHLKNKSLYWL